MNLHNAPTAQQFRRRVIGLSYVLSAPALGIILCFLFSLLDMTTLQTQWFLGSVLVYSAVVSPLLMWFQKRMIFPICAFLDQRSAETVTEEIRYAAFETVMRLPRAMGVFQGLNWVVPSILISLVLSLRFESFGLSEAAVMGLAGVAAGSFAASFVAPLVKARIEAVREILAGEIADPQERRRLIRRYPLRSKLLLGTVSITTLPVMFAALLFHAEAERALENVALAWQRRSVDDVHERLDREGLDKAVAAVLGTAGQSLDIALLDMGASASDPFLPEEIFDHVRMAFLEGAESGDSRRLPTEQSFSWRRVGTDAILIAVAPRGGMRLDTAHMWAVFLLLLAAAVVVGGGLSYLLADDLGRGSEALRDAADRVASGDLRKGPTIESEDEIGDLARAFESMAESLRRTVGQVAEAAGGVEIAAGDFSSASDSVASVSAEQMQGIQQTKASMEAISGQVRGIADSSQALNGTIEESSSSILELGASGDELNETASALSSRVAEVANSVEQMVQSVRQVSASTETLTEVSTETSASMEQMASALCEVDASAEETAQLSTEVVENAEAGQEKVRQTIQGMDAIRESTETAVRVIRNLGSRTQEIGTIVGVIDDVADETNLLALNAAIIAAQAGEQGRAFSVVADEIKDLADRVLALTKEIGALVHSVQEEVGNAIGAVERGAESVASGVDLSAEAGLSLEEITRASRQSGQRIEGIVAAVREQSKAASHVVSLMERVRSGVDEIHSAAREQGRGNEVVHRSTVVMRNLAQQVRATTEEQSQGSRRIRESVEGVQDVVERINSSLQEQSVACSSAAEFLEDMHERTKKNDASAHRLEKATGGLRRQSEVLREGVRRFRI